MQTQLNSTRYYVPSDYLLYGNSKSRYHLARRGEHTSICTHAVNLEDATAFTSAPSYKVCKSCLAELAKEATP